VDAPDLIPAAVRARDLVGYGRTPPAFSWPEDARVVINLVLVYESGSEYSVAWGDDRNDGWGEYADPGVQPPQRDPGTEAHYEYGSRAGVWRLARIFDEAKVPVTVTTSRPPTPVKTTHLMLAGSAPATTRRCRRGA